MGFEPKITPQRMAEMKRRFLEFPDMSHEERARKVAKEFPEFMDNTLRSYSRMCLGTSDKVFGLYLEGKISLAVIFELCTWEKEDQDYIIDEYIQQKLTPEMLRKIRRMRKEGVGYDEGIGRATGKIDQTKIQKHEVRKSLDHLLTDIADKGARWRAMVTQAIEMVGKEEAAAGVHEALFTKVILLRELIGTQYDFVNSRFNRYINLIRKRLQEGGQSPAEAERIVEGEAHAANSPGTGKGGIRGEEGDPDQDGSPVSDPSGQSEG